MNKYLTKYVQLIKAPLIRGFFTSKRVYAVVWYIGIGWEV